MTLCPGNNEYNKWREIFEIEQEVCREYVNHRITCDIGNINRLHVSFYISWVKRAEKKQAEQQEQIDAMAQTMSMLIIDKGKMRLKDADFPPIVLESTPKYLRRSKVPVVKAKVGPKIMTLMCDAEVFPLIPVKKEVKATVSGIYITAVKGIRGPLDTPQKKKGFFARLRGR